MTVSADKIVVSAMELRSAAPVLWDDFIEAIRHYSASHALALVRCNGDVLVKSQGYAQALSDIAVLLSNVQAKFDALRAQQVVRKP